MDYQDTKYVMIEAYPSLCIDEVDVLNDLFFGYGSSFHWENGQLTNGINKETITDYIKNAHENYKHFNIQQIEYEKERLKTAEPISISIIKRSIEYWQQSYDHMFEPNYTSRERVRELRRRRQFIEEGFDDCWFLLNDGKVGRRIREVRHYSHIMNVPNDVKDDWLDAAHKALDIAPDMKPTIEDCKWLALAKTKLPIRK